MIEIGTIVSWSSQSAGVTKRKRGEVVMAVLPGIRPVIRNAGSARDHVSYLIRSEDGRLYWPRVKHLEVIK